MEGYLDALDQNIIFRSPGIRPDIPQFVHAEKMYGSVVTSEMEVFFDVCPCRIIGVTGSDGKTTTTTIISELLKAEGYRVHLGGNIGRPLLSQADKMNPDDFAVLELSSFQLMRMKKSPYIAVVTNISPNHLDVHKDMAEYVQAKRNIMAYQNKMDRLVLNADNEIAAGFADGAKADTLYFSRHIRPENGVFLDAGTIFEARDGKYTPIMEENEIFLPGQHNVENFMAAFAAARDLVSRETMENVAKSFTGVAHRIEFVREKDNVKFYNDSIASSPTRTIAGLRSFDQKVILIAGGKDKGVPFDELGEEIIERVKKLFLTGLTAEKIKEAVMRSPKYAGSPEITVIEDFVDTVHAAAKAAKSGDIVLLSPACTSFDRFKNFEERGNLYKDIVEKL